MTAPDDVIVLVSGLPRSGTSMVMQMLRAGGLEILTDGLRGGDEDNPRGYFEDERVKALAKTGDNSWIAEARGKALKVVSLLLRHLPETHRYRVLFVHRALGEVLASQATMLARRNQPRTISDREMARVFESHLAGVRQMLAASPRFEVLDLHHENILADPVREARRIREFLECALHVDEMAAAVDRMLHRHRA